MVHEEREMLKDLENMEWPKAIFIHKGHCDVILEGIGDEEEEKRIVSYSKWGVKV